MKKLLLILTLFTSSIVQSQGLNLNPAMLGCLITGIQGGNCFEGTGIPFLDPSFGDAPINPIYALRARCAMMRNSWCGADHGDTSGYTKCRNAKIEFFKQKQIEAGEWNPPQGNYYVRTKGLRDYILKIENELTKKYNTPIPFFACNGEQREIFIKSTCGDLKEGAKSLLKKEETIPCRNPS